MSVLFIYVNNLNIFKNNKNLLCYRFIIQCRKFWFFISCFLARVLRWMKLTLLIIWCVFFYISILFLFFLNEWIIKLTFIPFPIHTITEANNVRWAWFSWTIGDLTVPRTSQSFPTNEKIKDIPHCLGWSATSPQTWEHFLLSRRGNNSLTSRIETRHLRLKKNPTNHGGASCFIRRPETSRPHRLMKTSSVQSKRHESHYKWRTRKENFSTCWDFAFEKMTKPLYFSVSSESASNHDCRTCLPCACVGNFVFPQWP